MTKAVAFVGFKKSGKTTTIEKVARILKERGYRVAIVKSMHSNFDKEGTDTWKFSRVADLVLVRAQDTDALLFKAKDVNALFSMISADVVLIEGFKSIKHVPKVICARSEEDVRELNDGLAIAVTGVIASSGIKEIDGLPVIDGTKEPERLADLVLKRGFMLPNIDCGLCGFNCEQMARLIVKGEKSVKDCVVLSSRPKVIVRIDGQSLPLKDWVQELVEKTIKGMLSAMKGYREGKKIEIIIND
ncbi:molybdopterin-guanine dinucleotide biosynthesis protein B [Pyrococcus abyssi]|uniref:Molybdopterin-guanine dinucleotide biosynthesis protein b related n=1 Tax=Pyrococcus abyssi (strain GE5 / Orsay) TaxID=272844 RepID=Q9V2I8_PYRAB|nr:molybdopterin-guanine dinucleotide biosynthesis protein B [Pyrococcus abyssi]CAB49010.1 mobB-like molybdopterin-guanine dinucleotide biosynthesis protein B related [Pyrococcus abyssi GE5]CCE69461.1 TPA: molybdopterin-guanine dinucleotide biosynthesis protein b related [Pyrococcus abyssi GE5]